MLFNQKNIIFKILIVIKKIFKLRFVYFFNIDLDALHIMTRFKKIFHIKISHYFLKNSFLDGKYFLRPGYYNHVITASAFYL